MKKLIAIVIAMLVALSLVSFASAEQQTFKVGICNYVDDASLNQIVDNIKQKLAAVEAEKGVKIEILDANCMADASIMSQIIADFIAEKVDVMIGVATPVAMAMQAMTEDNQIPVVFAAVSDPLSVGLVESLEKPGANVTGTSDFLDTNAVLNLIFAQNPEAKQIALLYDVGQDASTTPIAAAKAYLEAKGVSYKEYTGSNVSEVILAAQAIATDKADAVFTPTDNTIMTAELSIYEVFAEAGIPHYTGADSFALNGAFLGYGVDYANLGQVTGEMAVDVLAGAATADMAVRTFDNGIATINTETCEAIGLNYDDVAAAFAPLCTQVQSVQTAESF